MTTVTASVKFDMPKLFAAFPLDVAPVQLGVSSTVGNSRADWRVNTASAQQTLTLFGNNFGYNDDAVRVDGPALRLEYGLLPLQDGASASSWTIDGITIFAFAIIDSVMSTSKTDDAAMFARLFAGADTFTLSDDADVVLGLGGSDTIRGNGGADLISGGAGRDHMYGGASADDFIFDDFETSKGSSSLGRDVIYDFAKGSDDLDLRLIDANVKVKGDQKFDFGGTKAGANDVWYAKSGSTIIVFGDTNGDKRADFEIELQGVSSLSVGDFLL